MATGKTWSVVVPIWRNTQSTSETSYANVTVYFQEEYDTLANTSTLKVTKITGNNTIRSGRFYTAGSISIDGSTWYSWSAGDWQFTGLSGDNEFVTYSGASYPSGKTITHNDDGSKTISVSVKISSYYALDTDWTAQSNTVTNSVTLTSIPRASSITATDANIGSVSQLTITRKSTSYSHSIKYTFGSLSGYITSSGGTSTSESKFTTTSIGFTVPTTFYAQIPSAKTGTCTLTITTYSGSTQIGDAKTCTFTVTAAESLCAPTVSGTVVDTNSATIALTGSKDILVRYMSNALCTITATAKNSASISTKKIGGTTVSGTTRTISGIETDTVTFAATDSRGYSNSVDVTKSFISYIKLTNNSTAVRPDPTSGKVTLTIQGSCFNGNFGTVDNAVTATYSIDGGDAVDATVTMSGNTYSVTLNLTGFTYTSSFSIEVVVTDKLMTVSKTLPIQKGIPVFDWGEEDFSFNVEVDFGVKGQSARNLMSHGTTNGDFDSLLDHGVYWMQLASCTNGPGSSGFGFLEVVNGFPGAASGVLQRFTYYDTLDVYVRSYMNNTWSGWYKVQTSIARNLLDNSDFTNPVNQRNSTKYTGSGYSVDRWRAYHSYTTHTVVDGGIKISTTTSGYSNIYQPLNQDEIDATQTLTAAACDIDGNIYIWTGVPTETGATPICVYYSGSNLLFRLTEETTWKWAALYYGEYTTETLPPYVPKGYGVELMECQRYYQYYGSVCLTCRNNGYASMNLPIAMRVVPTITVGSTTVFAASSDGSESYSPTLKASNKNYIYMTNNFYNGFATVYFANVHLSADL